MVSTPDYRKGKRFGHKSAIMLTDEHSKYSFFAQSGCFCENQCTMTLDTFPPFESLTLVWYQMYGSFKLNGGRLFLKRESRIFNNPQDI